MAWLCESSDHYLLEWLNVFGDVTILLHYLFSMFASFQFSAFERMVSIKCFLIFVNTLVWVVIFQFKCGSDVSSSYV